MSAGCKCLWNLLRSCILIRDQYPISFSPVHMNVTYIVASVKFWTPVCNPKGSRNTVRRFTMERNTPAWLRWYCSQIDFFLWSRNIYCCKKRVHTLYVGHDINIVVILIYILLLRLAEIISIYHLTHLFVKEISS